jgi:diphthamide synthase (EF-2-diphthine--ammonia ligase)
MSYCISHMIGIRTGGVFSGEVDVEDMKSRITKIISKMKEEEIDPEIDLSFCLSKELTGPKGSYVVIAGVFNFWNFKDASEFVKRLSEEFGVEVIHICWDEEQDTVQCQICLAAKSLFKLAIGRILRRVC